MNIEKLNSPLASTDEEIHGAEREIGGITFRVRAFSQSNREAMVLINKLQRENAEEELEELLVTHLPEVAAVMVCDWKGMTDTDGEEIPYSNDTAVKVFSVHGKLAQAVFNAASELGTEMQSEVESDAGNSES